MNAPRRPHGVTWEEFYALGELPGALSREAVVAVALGIGIDEAHLVIAGLVAKGLVDRDGVPTQSGHDVLRARGLKRAS